MTPERLESIMVRGKECDIVLTNVIRENSVGDAENCIFTFKRQNGERTFFSFTIVISGTNMAFLSL